MHTYTCMHTCPPDLLLVMKTPVTMRTNKTTTIVIPAEATATGTTMLFVSIGIWLHVAAF